MLEKRNKWIAAEEERRKKDDQAQQARAKKAVSDATKVLMEDPEACTRCAEDSELSGLLCSFLVWLGWLMLW